MSAALAILVEPTENEIRARYDVADKFAEQIRLDCGGLGMASSRA